MIIIVTIAIILTVIVVEKITKTTIYPKSQFWYFNHHFQLQFCIWQFWNCAWSGLNSFEYLIKGRLIDWFFLVFMKTIIIFIIIIIIIIIFTIIIIITSLSRWSRLGEKKLSHLQKIFQNGSLLLPRLTLRIQVQYLIKICNKRCPSTSMERISKWFPVPAKA